MSFVERSITWHPFLGRHTIVGSTLFKLSRRTSILINYLAIIVSRGSKMKNFS